MKFEKLVLQNPCSAEEELNKAGVKTVVSGSNDFYGANSLETFSSASGLTYTHEDADGFLDYPTSFAGKSANYWRKDAGVKVWAYEETYDNWQDTYGMDAVMVFYHSGHGNMDSNGVFQAPLGGKWDNRDWAFSNNMAFANEELRYLFWSTCFSLRVSGPDNPVRTWWNPNKGGLRMMFGYETTSVDDPNYGKFFWDEWKKGKTFARAFLDASWRISHNQVPVVMAAGANASDAINRLNNERFFSRTPVTKGWYQWQWIGTLPTRSFASERSVPKQLSGIILNNKFANDEFIAKIAGKVGVTQKDAAILLDPNGNRMLSTKEVHTNVNNQGTLNLYFGKTNIQNASLLDENKAIKIAQNIISDLGLNEGIKLTLGNIRHCFTSGGTLKGSGTIEKPYAVETIVQFRQSHEGVKSINSDHGLIAVSIDNDGRIVNLYDSTKLVLGEVDKRALNASSPPDPKGSSGTNTEAQFKKKIDRILADSESKSSVLHETVGYDFSGNLGTLVHQKEIEVDFGQNLKKRYKVRVPLE
ncbi:MAG: hypothetical protein HRU72_12025 [Planctomycetia bacterium]|nr:MAG: hypothetical protein HRU72_12025 [Planctomycetia bacterium]TVL96016.1 MAG: hypothetical protein CV082_08760 [Candidatus Brocadia sp. BL1]HQU31078.1 DUF6345 domain-containing protein [Candidatus Brocadia sapporoensis]